MYCFVDQVYQGVNGENFTEDITWEPVVRSLGARALGPNGVRWSMSPETPEEHHRSRRSTPDTKYVELVTVVDFAEYEYYYKKNDNNKTLGNSFPPFRPISVSQYTDIVVSPKIIFPLYQIEVA